MKNHRTIKLAALICVLALGLLLTSCYVPPDEISGTNNISTASRQPFDTYAPTATATPTQTPTQPPITIDVTATPGTGSDWGNIATATPANTAPQTGVTVTPSPAKAPASVTPTPAKATATPTATSGVLKKGAEGARVKQVQQRLKDLGYYSGSVDGKYGDGTVAAVKAFQKAHGLKADGTVGTQTMTRLYSKDAKTFSQANPKATAPPKKQTKPTATKTPRPTATPNLTHAGYLQTGSSGKNVRTLQTRLIQLGWLGGKADGKYGSATIMAVRAFQKKTKGLYEDGIAGPDTQKAVYSANAARSAVPVASLGESLREGAQGGTVRALQTRLKKLGYLKSSVDGSYGKNTVTAVKAFQQNNGLTADGIAGASTLELLYSDAAVAADGTTGHNTTENQTATAPAVAGADSTGKTSTGFTAVASGAKGSEVTRIQTRLKELGYFNKNIDGSYGTNTRDAIIAFQRVNNLRPDGIAGPATQRALFGYSADVTYTTLRPGDRNNSVAQLQYALYELGYYDGDVTGVYDDMTANSVREFQQTNGISVDGVAGNKTLQLVYSANARGASAGTATLTTLRKGDKGESVVEMQACLRDLGYLEELTGVYDNATVEAVKEFQKANGLSIDGVAGAATLKLLYSDNPVANY